MEHAISPRKYEELHSEEAEILSRDSTPAATRRRRRNSPPDAISLLSLPQTCRGVEGGARARRTTSRSRVVVVEAAVADDLLQGLRLSVTWET